MLKEAKKWVQTLEDTLTEMAKEFNKTIEELDDVFTDWYDNGGSDFDLEGSCTSPEAFAWEYRADREEEAESEAYEEVYKKMRAFAAGRGYELEYGEIESIIKEAEEYGDGVLGCSDGRLRELVEDWVADHQV